MLGFRQDVASPPGVARALEHDYQALTPVEAAEDIQILEEYLRKDPENRKVRKRLALLLLERLGEPTRAVPLLARIVEDAPESAGWHYCLARALRESGRMEKAAEHFSNVVRLQPENKWAFYELGNTLSGTGRLSEAEAAYRCALGDSATEGRVRVALAKVLWASGRTAEAAEIARSVLASDPGDQEAAQLGSAARQREGLEAAAHGNQRVPGWIGVRALDAADRAVVEAYQLKTRAAFQRASSLLERGLKRFPNDLVKRKVLASIYLEKLHAPADAVSHLRLIVGKAPKAGAWWQMLATAQAETGDGKGAVESYRSAVLYSPKDVWLFYKLGRVQRSLGRTVEAERSFTEALEVEPGNVYVRRELAHCHYDLGRAKQAEAVARGLVLENPRDGEARVVLGDVARLKLNFSVAKEEYNEALSSKEAYPLAAAGLQAIDRLKRPEVGSVYYSFKDTDGFTQSGLFNRLSLPVTERLKSSLVVNDRYFSKEGQPEFRRLEASVGADYWLLPEWKIAGAGNVFEVENRGARGGGTAAVYYNPSKYIGLWTMQRVSEPVNDSYAAARDVLRQSVLSAGVNLHASKEVLFSATGSRGDYSDGNVRKAFLGGVHWYAPMYGAPVARMELEAIEYAFSSPGYSSPGSYKRVRPGVDWGPRLADWLRLDLHGELSYVCGIGDWGTGFSAGLRFNKGETLDFGGGFMKYEIPGGQSTWSGRGVKADLTWRF